MRIISVTIHVEVWLQKSLALREVIIRNYRFEVKYEEILKGQPGKILTTTDARGCGN